MSTLREQISAARKAQVEIQLDFVRNFTDNVVDSTGKVLALNLSTGRNTLEKSADALRKLVTATSPRELADLSRASPASFDTLLSYSSELFNIASRAQANLIKAATPAALAAPAQALRALPVEEVEVVVQAEIPAGVQAEVAPEQADPDAVAAVPLDETPVAEPQAAEEVQAEPVADAAPAAEPQPAAAPAAEPAAEPISAIAEAVPVPAAALQATPLAEAVSDAIGAAQAPVLAASPIVSAPAEQVEISGIEPVDATPPQAPVQADAPATKSRRKKER